MFPRTLRDRIFLILFMLSALPLFLAGTVALPEIKRTLIASSIDQLAAEADLRTLQTYEWISQGQNAVLLASRLDEARQIVQLRHFPSRNKVESQIRFDLISEYRSIVDSLPYVKAISVLHPTTGRVEITTDPAQLGRIRIRDDYFKGGREGIFVSDIVYSVGREKPVLHISSPLMNDKSEISAVIVAEMNIEDLQSIFLKRADPESSKIAYLVDAYGFGITPSTLGGSKSLMTIVGNEGVSEVLERRSGFKTYINSAGVKVVGVYRWLENGHMGLLVEADYSEVSTLIVKIRTLVIMLGLTLFTLSIIAATFLVSRFIGPIRRIADTAKALQDGDYSDRAKIEGSMEVKQLATTFNAMADQIHESHQNLERLVSERTDELAVSNIKLLEEIKERTSAEEELKTSQQLLNKSQEIAHLGSWHLDIKKNILSWSDEAYRIFGRDPEEFEGTYEAFLDTIHPDDREMVNTTYTTAIENNLPYECIHRIIRSDGEVRVVLEKSEDVVDENGETIHSYGFTQDITELKQVEEEKLELERQFQHAQKVESLGVLAGGIAHDFNNLLMGIIGNVGMAQMKILPESPGYVHIERIEKAAERAADLTNQMLAYSGKGKFVEKSINLSTVFEEMDSLMRVTLDKNVLVKLNLDRDLPAIDADPSQIHQVIINLLTNASDSFNGKSGKVSVRTGTELCDAKYLSNFQFGKDLSEGEYVFFEVSDTGSGMKKKTIDRIFDPFFSTKEGGRGLGLSAVLGIVKGHNGAIEVTSEPDKGTTFKLLFPVSEKTVVEMVEERLSHHDYKGSGTILLVDDEEDVRDIAASMLEEFGFDVIQAADGQEALELFRERADEISLVLLDLSMPGMGGIETFRHLKQHWADVKVILSSGYSEEDAVSSFTGQGLADFIHKPYKPEELISKIRKVLET